MGAILAVAGIAAWIAVQGVSAGVVLAGVALLLAGAAPVMAAGVMRGREERAARKDALFEQ